MFCECTDIMFTRGRTREKDSLRILSDPLALCVVQEKHAMVFKSSLVPRAAVAYGFRFKRALLKLNVTSHIPSATQNGCTTYVCVERKNANKIYTVNSYNTFTVHYFALIILLLCVFYIIISCFECK